MNINKPKFSPGGASFYSVFEIRPCMISTDHDSNHLYMACVAVILNDMPGSQYDAGAASIVSIMKKVLFTS